MWHPAWRRGGTAVALIALTCSGAAATAQETPAFGARMSTAAQAPPPGEAFQKWEIEAHVGSAFVRTPTEGSGRLPSAVSGDFPVVSSWYFGDGAAFFNNVIRATGSGPPIIALDPVLTSAGIERGPGLAIGFRVSRAIDRRFSVEFSFDGSLVSVRLTGDSHAGIEASGASFEPAFSSLSFVRAAESSATIRQQGGSRLSASGALNYSLLTGRRSTPYVTVGGGIVSSSGTVPNATVVGKYLIPLASGAVVDNTDTVDIRHEEATSPILVIGGGFKFDLTRRSGIRSDVRFSIRSSHESIVIDATPTHAGAELGVFSGPPINGFETFNGSGHEIQTILTVGYFRRF